MGRLPVQPRQARTGGSHLSVCGLHAALLPRLTLLYETDREKFSAEMVKIYRNCYLWGLVTACFLSFLSPWLVSLVFGKDYEGASSLFRIYAYCLIFMLVGSVRAMHLIIIKNTMAHLWTCLVFLPLAPFTVYLPAKFFGAPGLAAAMIFNYAWGSILSSKILPSCRQDWILQQKAISSMPDWLIQKSRRIVYRAH
jgi:O-antigen/teichoic acid export membrane protein